MTSKLVQSKDIQAYLDKIAGLGQTQGNARTKLIVRRIVADLFATLDELDISAGEFWRALHFLQQAAPEFGLIAPGLGFDHFIDLRLDAQDRAAGITDVTPRTIEGPLYVAGAPLSTGFARLDDGTDAGETLIMSGTVRNVDGTAIVGAIVDVWHANSRGAYSTFDPSQSPYNNRRRIRTDAAGRYRFRTIVPSGYSVPPGGATDQLLQALGRHGNRPAHIHFFVSAADHRHLTTQINIPGDRFLRDDFAFATHEDLIIEMTRQTDSAALREQGLTAPFMEAVFDFTLPRARSQDDAKVVERTRAVAASS